MRTRRMSDIVRNCQPITLRGDATVQHACKLMHGHRIGAILVTDAEGRLEGIFTGRDAVRLLAEGRSPAHTHLCAVMTYNPTTMAPEHNAVEALRLMQDGGFRHVPLAQDGKLIGIASAADFRAVEHARLDDETGYWERL